MGLKYGKVSEWLADCRATMEVDEDCFILFTGHPGRGKSTLMRHVLRALDPTYNLERTHFKLRDFIWHSPDYGAGTAHGLDEFDLDNRSGMTRKTKVTLKYFRESRGLNHYVGICFPFLEQIEGAVADERIRYRVDVGKKGEVKGFFTVMEMQEFTVHRPRAKPRVIRKWVTVSKRFPFPKWEGPEWEAYKAKKRANLQALKNLALQLDRDEVAGEEDSAGGDGASPLIRSDGRDEFLGGLEAKYRDRAGPRADVRGAAP
jgi:energy-coupling factor transporter ATP-binding protein EcfA2